MAQAGCHFARARRYVIVDRAGPDNEIQSLQRALDEHGATERGELARLVGARYWGPGVFSEALRKAVAEGRVRRLTRTTFAANDGGSDDRASGHSQ